MSDRLVSLPDLGADSRDRSVAVLRAVLGSVPVAGAVLSELITNIVPNQRMDRLERYLKELAMRLEAIGPSERLGQRFQDATNVALVEDGAHQAARALTEERILRIVDCVANGISSDDTDHLLKRRLLLTLGDLDDQHLAILHAHANWSASAVERLRPKQVATLGRPSTLKEVEGLTLWQSALGKLEQLALLYFKPKLRATDAYPPFPLYDSQGRPQGHYQITRFGVQLLVSVGLASED